MRDYTIYVYIESREEEREKRSGIREIRVSACPVAAERKEGHISSLPPPSRKERERESKRTSWQRDESLQFAVRVYRQPGMDVREG